MVDVQALRAAFDSGRTRSLEWRLKQLQGILEFATAEKDQVCEALYRDLGRSDETTEVFELLHIESEVKWISRHLRKWMKEKPIASTVLFCAHTKYIVREPLGVVLVISPWNYPVWLSLMPVIGALAAGNCVVLKPSELAPATAKVFVEQLPKYLDKDCFAVLTGDADVTKEFLDTQRFDHITFTGSDRVGKAVMTAAAKNLTPVVLECGGKSPCIVLGDCTPMKAAKCIIHYKMMNAGQTCIAPDYVLVQSTIKEDFLRCLELVLKEKYPIESLRKDKGFSKIINRKHFDRLVKLIEHGQCDIRGGTNDPDSLFIAPTLAIDLKDDHPLMQEEIFGPILPIQEFDSLDDAIGRVNARSKPLAIYLFTNNNKVIQQVKKSTSSGALCVNECILHNVINGFPFGGVGLSGIGRLHGKYSFKQYSNEKSVLVKSERLEALNDYLSYPPYTPAKVKRLRPMLTSGVVVPTSRRLSLVTLQLLVGLALFGVGIGVGMALR